MQLLEEAVYIGGRISGCKKGWKKCRTLSKDFDMVKRSRRSWLYVGVGLLVLLGWKQFSTKLKSTGGKETAKFKHQIPQVKYMYSPPKEHSANACKLYAAPWFEAGKFYEEIQLIFYGKPVMQAIKHICVQRRWKLTLIYNSSKAGASALHQMTSKPELFTILYTSSRSFHQPIVRHLSNSTNALVSGIRYAYTITGAKKGQLLAFQAFFNDHGCDLRNKYFMPISYILDDPQECRWFFKHAGLSPDSWWILKPSQGYGGEGISVHSNMSFFNKNFALCNNNKEQFIVQEYLKNPLLVEKRKFDVRGFVLIASTNPYILFYHEGYLRLSVEEFDPLGGSSVHLTNSHIQTRSKHYSVEKHYWSFKQFQSYLDVHHQNNSDFVAQKLVPFIKKVALFILQTGMFINPCVA